MLKKIIYGILAMVLVIIAIPVISGFISSFNPDGAVNKAKEVAEESSKLYIPSGYKLSQYKKQSVVEEKVFYTTILKMGDKEIMITEKPNTKTVCNGTQKSFADIKTCYEIFTKVGSPTLQRITWNVEGTDFTVTVLNDVSDSELGQLIGSIK